MLDTPTKDEKVNNSPQDFKIPVTFGPEGAIGTRVPMPYLCWFLGQQLQNTNRPVTDLTGRVTELRSFTPSWKYRQHDGSYPISRRTPAQSAIDRPSIEAVMQQLGEKVFQPVSD